MGGMLEGRLQWKIRPTEGHFKVGGTFYVNNSVGTVNKHFF